MSVSLLNFYLSLIPLIISSWQILYGLPLAVNKLEDLSALRTELEKYGAIVRLLVDIKSDFWRNMRITRKNPNAGLFSSKSMVVRSMSGLLV